MTEIPVVTQQLVREIATQVIRRALHGPRNGEPPVIDTCRDHPAFMQLPEEDRDNLIDAVYDATETAQITISWNDTIVSVIGAQPTGILQIDGTLTEAQVEDLKARFLDAQIRVVTYPEIDYPQELRDMYEPMPLPPLSQIESWLPADGGD